MIEREQILDTVQAYIDENPKSFVAFSVRYDRRYEACVIDLVGHHMNKEIHAKQLIPAEIVDEVGLEPVELLMTKMYTEALRSMFVFEKWRDS